MSEMKVPDNFCLQLGPSESVNMLKKWKLSNYKKGTNLQFSVVQSKSTEGKLGGLERKRKLPILIY